jgi:hypothetical protein
MRPVRLLVAVLLTVACATAADAAPITVDYAVMTSPGSGLNLGTNTTTLGGLTAEGFSATVTGSAGTPDYPLLSTLVAQNLFVRNESPNDLGLGVCSTGETCPSGSSGNGEQNELSNEGLQELIRLTLPAGSTWVSLSLSSLDANTGGEIERGWLFGSNSQDPSTATPLFNFSGSDSLPNQSFDISAFTYTYLFLVPWDHSAGSGTNNDFLLSEVIYDNGKPTGDVPVPEPATLTLLGLGLAASARAMRGRIGKP